MPRARRAAVALLLACAALPALRAAPVAAQNVTARTVTAQIPRHGELWIEVAPVFQGWDEHFGAHGGRVPLADPFNGPLASLLYPGPEAVASDLNADASALGYTPVSADQASLGTLHMAELNREIRVIPLRLEVGFLDRFSVEASLPIVWTKAEPFFGFDSAGATVLSGSNAIQNPVPFFNGLGGARDSLAAHLEAGTVPSSQQAQAQALVASSSAFLEAIQRRIITGDLLPLATTTAGQQLLAYYASLQQQFISFGLQAPNFSLPDVATSADMRGWLSGAFLQGEPLGATVRSWTAGEVEVGARVALLDGYRPDSAAGGIELRTTAGILARLALRGSGSLPYQVPGDFMGVPVGDGQRDVAVSLYQDVRLGHAFEINAAATYGVQMADRLELRLHPPGQPFATPGTAVQVDRNLGDYVRLRVDPHLALDPHVLVGLEYRLWHKAADHYRLVGGGTSDAAAALATLSAQTRHRLGVNATYRPGGATSGAELAFVYQVAIGGRGVTTPVADLATFHIRLPAHIF
jgi:hypothetical protein